MDRTIFSDDLGLFCAGPLEKWKLLLAPIAGPATLFRIPSLQPLTGMANVVGLGPRRLVSSYGTSLDDGDRCFCLGNSLTMVL